MTSHSRFSRLILISSVFVLSCWGQTNTTEFPNCPQPFAKCVAYGVDFQGGESYFQNTASNEAFDFTSQFDQCQNDIAQNILVDPNGNEYMCSDTNLQPFNVNAKSTCTKQKASMFDGGWAMLIISNNGQCAPIAFERDVQISAAPQKTTTFTPTVVFSSTTTLQTNITTTTTLTSTTTAPPPFTITSPASFFTKTTTITPPPVTTTTTSKLVKTITRYTFTVVPATRTLTASCSKSKAAAHPDSEATHTPRLVAAKAMRNGAAPAKATDKVEARAVPFDKETRLRERKARLARSAKLHKRAPDQATTTVTDSNPANFVTRTSTISTTITNKFEVDKTITTTLTPPPATVYSGVSTVPVRTTLPPKTSTRTKTILAFTTVTSTITIRPTLVKTVTPSGVATCTKSAGRLVAA